MSCCSFTSIETWSPHIKVRGENKQYDVALHRKINLLGAELRKDLYINGEMIPHRMVHNRFNPVCGAGGEYEWEIEGHKFLIVFNALSFRRLKDHCLFVDGIEVNTGLEYSAFWKRQGFYSIIAGGLFMLIALLWGVVLPGVLLFNLDLRFRILQGVILGSMGLPLCLAGLIVIHKNGKPRYQNSLTTADLSPRWAYPPNM